MESKERKFYEKLEEVFTGAEIKGKGGFVNLLAIKHKYYSKVIDKLKDEIDNEEIISGPFKEEFFDKLYYFFNSYFSESGSIYFTKTRYGDKKYEMVYEPNKDVALFWKTNMLYYIKTDVMYNDVDIKVHSEKNDTYFEIKFNTSGLKNKQNNEIQELEFKFDKKITKEDDKDTGNLLYLINVLAKEKDNKIKKQKVDKENENDERNEDNEEIKEDKNKSKNITYIQQISKDSGIDDEDAVADAINQFLRQSKIDFFINKNAEKFLKEQLNLYIHQILIDEKNEFEEKRLNQLKIFKKFANKIIEFIAQFENELVKMWNKPKFVLNSNYVISVDKISNKIIEKIEKATEGLKEQKKEWVKLGIVDNKFKFDKDGRKEHPHLPIDTKYFKELELDIIGQFDNLDEALDGRLIHSENYQALNTMKDRYSNQVQCIYIDPPFNTGKDFKYIDAYQDSTWLSIMFDRIKISYELLKNSGNYYLHLDRYANYYGRLILDDVFGKENFANEIVWRMGWVSGLKTQGSAFVRNHDTIFYYIKNKDDNYFNKGKSIIPYKTLDYKNYEKDIDNIVSRIEIDKSSIRNLSLNIITWDGMSIRLFPSNKKFKEGNYHIEDTWNCSVYESIDSNKIKRNVAEYTPNGSEITQKPEELLARIISLSSNKEDIILDFFSGSGTSVATAHKLNRKWIGIELGDYFDSDLFVRMKWVVNGKEVGISKKTNDIKKGGFFKYYDLEQYEDTLSKAIYEDNDTIYEDNPFTQYIFFADRKFTDVISEKKKGKLVLDFNKLYKNIDLPETISLLKGKAIKKITKDEVFLEGDEKGIIYNTDKMDNKQKIDFVHMLKDLLWWD